MSLTPPRAWNSQAVPDSPDRHFDFFAPQKGLFENDAEPVLGRQTTFRVELLIVAGELLADSLSKRNRSLLPDPAPGRAGEDDASPETIETAGSGRAKPQDEEACSPGREQAPSNTQPHDDTRTHTDTTSKVSSPHSADRNPRVCVPSRGIETPSFRTRTHDPHVASHHHALLHA